MSESRVLDALRKMRKAIVADPKLSIGMARVTLFPDAEPSFHREVYMALEAAYKEGGYSGETYTQWAQRQAGTEGYLVLLDRAIANAEVFA